jgi:Trypsin-like serine proteases, typically periplasmic, contain C-terminal PDZ domain
MIRRITLALVLGLVVTKIVVMSAHAQSGLSVQESVLRAKPATVLVIAEVSAEVSLNCGAGPQSVTPPAFRETGTGWFIDPSGWVMTNGHVVQPAYETPRWLINQMAQRAVTTACMGRRCSRRACSPGNDRRRKKRSSGASSTRCCPRSRSPSLRPSPSSSRTEDGSRAR